MKVGDVLVTFRTAEAEAPTPRAEEREMVRPERKVPSPKLKKPEPARPEPARPEPGRPAAPPEIARKEGPVPASPATRRLAREFNVDLSQVTPTGPGGLVTAEDVRAFAEKGPKPEEPLPPREAGREAKPEEARPVVVPAPKLPDFSKWGPVERVPLRSIRKATAKQMALAWSQIPHVSNHDVADMTQLDVFRKKHKAEIEAKGGRLTHTVFALKAVATALKAFPRFNSTIDTEAGEIVLKQYHIGVAVATDDGLIVPVIRDVDRKSILDLSVELKEIADRTRQRKVGLEELQGGTFSITNVGHMGGGQDSHHQLSAGGHPRHGSCNHAACSDGG